MNELTERELRRRFAVQDDPAFAPRATFAELVGATAPVERRRALRRPLIAGLGIAALLGLAVAAVALRRPERPAQPVATVTTSPTTSEPPPATTTARDQAGELARRMLADAELAVRPSAATCHAMSSAERELARSDFGPTALPLFACTLTFAGKRVPYVAQLLPNGCFTSHPTGPRPKTPAILACGVTPAPPVHGMQALGQEIAGSVAIASAPVVRAQIVHQGLPIMLTTYRAERGVTCSEVATGSVDEPKGAEEPTCEPHGDRPIDLRLVPIRIENIRTTVLAGLVDSEISAIRVGDRRVHVDGPTIPGSTRRAVLIDIAGTPPIDVLTGLDVAQTFRDGIVSSGPLRAATPAPDGRTLAYLRGITDPTGRPQLVLDEVLWFTGADAVAACQQLGDADCRVDYQIVNPSGRTTTASISPAASIQVVDWAHCCDRTLPATPADLAAAMRAKSDDPIRQRYRVTSPFWVTVQGGRVTKIEEQYLP